MALARDGKQVSVIHALEQVRVRSEEKVQARIDSVLDALSEESLYPLSTELVVAEAQALAAVNAASPNERPSTSRRSSTVTDTKIRA